MSQKSKKLSKLTLRISLLLSLAASAEATQRVEGATERHIEVSISAKEQNRLAVAGRHIVTVVPSAKGAITYQKDEVQGALYFALSDLVPAGATVTLFVGDDRGQTYKIILVPKSIPGEEIILQPPQVREVSANASPSTGSKASSYQRRAKALTLLMADDSPSTRAQQTLVNKEIPLWKEGRLVFLSKIMDGDIVGESYRLTNTSPSPMALAEQELYRKGVRSVAIEHHTLAQGQATEIFVVRDRGSHE
jgi:conjugal transfer pilus assembly protein TraK